MGATAGVEGKAKVVQRDELSVQSAFESELDLINWQEAVLARRLDRRKAGTERLPDAGNPQPAERGQVVGGVDAMEFEPRRPEQRGTFTDGSRPATLGCSAMGADVDVRRRGAKPSSSCQRAAASRASIESGPAVVSAAAQRCS